MKELLEKYNINQEVIDMIIKLDQLSESEILDLDFMEDRIETHLENEWPALIMTYKTMVLSRAQ